MDIISHLSRIVTPNVLGDEQTPNKSELLKQFYAVFAAKLSDPDTYTDISKSVSGKTVAHDDAGLFERVWTDVSKRDILVKELAKANHVEESVTNSLMVIAAPLAYNEIATLAGTTPVPQFLQDNLSGFQGLVPSWATALLPAGLLVAGTTGVKGLAESATTTASQAGQRISDTVSSAPLQSEEKEGGSFLKALLPIIGLIIFGTLAWLLLKGCQQNPEPVATPPVVTATENNTDTSNSENQPTTVTTTATEDASLRLATGEGNTLYACRITAGDDSLNTTIMDHMKSVFGDEAAKCRADIDDNFATAMPANEHLSAILPLVKGVDNASILIKGSDIVVNAPDSEALAKLIADIQAVAPNMNVTAEKPLDLENAVSDSLAAADEAISNLGDNPEPEDVARALSLQVINFKTDKSDIPDVNKAFLNKAVTVIEQVPDMKLMIIGHTDSQGSDSYNAKLSQERANSVKEYLISQGVDADKLATKGKGETDPIADNSTEQGRFYNRRIEFKVFGDNEMTGDGIAVKDNIPDDSTLAPIEDNSAADSNAEKANEAEKSDSNNE